MFSAAALLVLFLQAHAQVQPLFNHPLSDRRESASRRTVAPTLAAPDTLKVLVAMVEFQEDIDARTSGTGRFDLGSTTKLLIDPPPHDRTYVLNHMTFAENYFRKCSDGKLMLTATVLDSIYRVPLQLQQYSPPRTSTTNAELGLFVNDAWHAVDSATPGIPFNQYDAFMLVHAGVGRDVDLTSLYGYDPTPYDMPSVYMSSASLRKIYGTAYAGVPVNDSSFYISSSIIIPETEDREVSTVTGTATLELGINGLVVASIGSHLGLPDLFDTKTGRSAIGRFGLMDGQSIFSWSGVFPPEPSAWEKYFLGWVTPVTVPPGSALYDLPAVSRSGGEDTIYRVPISASEYFLVENRNRDANRDSARVTIVQNGATVERVWARDTAAGFNAFDQDSLYGVVTDVDEFDWSLPGGVNTRTNEWYEGGILIWHIDENIINANYFDDAVNADPEHRGVDLEEGDGSQDIGQSYGFISPGGGSEDGTPFDFWYKGNPATPRVISNVFSPSSHPNSLSNTLANSHITLKDFSLRGPVMQARIELGDNQVAPLPGFPKNAEKQFRSNAVSIIDISTGTGQAIVVASTMYGLPTLTPMGLTVPAAGPASLFAWDMEGNPLPGFYASGVLAQIPGIVRSSNFLGKPVVADLNGDLVTDFVAGGSARYINDLTAVPLVQGWSATDADHDSLADPRFTVNPRGVTTSVVLADTVMAVGTQGGAVVFLSRAGTLLGEVAVEASDTSDIVGLSLLHPDGRFIAVSANGTVAVVAPSGVIAHRSLGQTMASAPATAAMSASAGLRTAVASREGLVYLFDENLESQTGFPVATGGEILSAPSLADIDGDGQRDIVVTSGRRIAAISSIGFMLNNYPIVLPTQYAVHASPIVADMDGNGTNDIVAVTQEGVVVAYDKSGTMAAGFPIQSGINIGSSPAAFYIPGTCPGCPNVVGLAVASEDGNVYAWRTATLGTGVTWKNPWPQFLHDSQNTGLDASTSAGSPCASCGQLSNAYNWPNPVKAEDGFRTQIRYYLTGDAAVTVKIFDLAGDLVAELQGAGKGGFDNEIAWDCSAIQSGIYFAHIDAQGAAAGSAVIKIAVVR